MGYKSPRCPGAGSWPRWVQVTGSAPRIGADPPPGRAAVVPGLCTGGGGGPTHHVWICASPRGVWKSQILELGWEEVVPGPCREGQEKNQQQDPSLPTALGHPDHSLLAVVPDPVWEEDSCLHRHHSECPLKCGVHMGMVLPHGMSRAPPKEHRAGQGLLPVTVWCLSLLLLFVLSWDSAPLVPWLLEGWDMWEWGKARGSGDANLVSAPSAVCHPLPHRGGCRGQ